MGKKKKKYYKPILGEGEELIHSKKNTNRVRGLTKDKNNNRGINEWEEVEITEKSESPIRDMVLQAACEVLCDVGRDVAKTCWYDIIYPVCKRKLTELISSKRTRFLKKDIKRLYYDTVAEEKTKWITVSSRNEELVDQKNVAVAISSILQIAKESESKTIQKIENTTNKPLKTTDNSIVKKATIEFAVEKLNKLLSQDKFMVDEETNNKIFIWLGGGIKKDGEYITVNPAMVEQAIYTI